MNSKRRRKLLKKGYSRAAAHEAWRRHNESYLKNLADEMIDKGMAFDVFLAGQPDRVLDIFLEDLQREGSNQGYKKIVELEIGKRAEKLFVTVDEKR